MRKEATEMQIASHGPLDQGCGQVIRSLVMPLFPGSTHRRLGSYSSGGGGQGARQRCWGSRGQQHARRGTDPLHVHRGPRGGHHPGKQLSVRVLPDLFLEFGGILSGSSHWSSSPACKVQAGSLVGPSPSRLGFGGPGLR